MKKNKTIYYFEKELTIRDSLLYRKKYDFVECFQFVPEIAKESWTKSDISLKDLKVVRKTTYIKYCDGLFNPEYDAAIKEWAKNEFYEEILNDEKTK